jgi:hypothetical protein
MASTGETTQDLHKKYEPHADTPKKPDGSADYAPDLSKSVSIPPERQAIVDTVQRLYSITFTDKDLEIYDSKAIYDDPLSYCDTREKIAAQWAGLKKIMSSSETKGIEVIKNTPDELIMKMHQVYQVKPLNNEITVNNLVSLGFDSEGKVKYHKDQWNEKDYSHQGIGKFIKTLSGDHMPKVVDLPDNVKS